MSVPTWIPRTEADLQSAIDEGLLQESHSLDIKGQLDTGPKASKSLAIDLAAFAVDGGCIYIGIGQHEKTLSSPLSLVPIDLRGQTDRVNQVARSSLIDEPLDVYCHEIASRQESGHGYLVIVVPPSPAAPHMVDGRYRGRGGVTNSILSDAEVRRIHDRQHAARVSSEAMLNAEIRRDPTPEDKRKQAHLFLLAHPVTARVDQVFQAMQRLQRHPRTWLEAELMAPLRNVPVPPAEPSVASAVQYSQRATGWAYHPHSMDQERRVQPNAAEEYLLDLEIGEDGTLRLFCGRATVTTGDGSKLAFEGLIAGLAAQVVVGALTIAAKANYFGTWSFGLAVTSLRGAASASARSASRWIDQPTRFSEDHYLRVSQVSHERLRADPAGVVADLFEPLNRALGGYFDFTSIQSALGAG
jgi:hypothetical protein